jgi:ornithine carbamoyltransferase
MGAETAPRPRSYLRVLDLSDIDLRGLLELAARMKENPGGWETTLRSETLSSLFEKPSTRTRVSFEAAAHRLGMLPVMLRPDELQLTRGEPISDTARVLSAYSAAVVIRTFAQRVVEEVATWATVPVINALTDDHHPCQALADLLTLKELFGHLDGLKLAYVGDGNNVAHSLMEAGALAGMHVVVASPEGYESDPAVLSTAQDVAGKHGSSVQVVRDPREAVRDADAVYTDVWVSMGQDAEREERLRAFSGYQVTAELMDLAKPEAVFLHCLPAHRGQEVAAEVIDGPRSAVWQQAANRLPTEQALVYALVTGDWQGSR